MDADGDATTGDDSNGSDEPANETGSGDEEETENESASDDGESSTLHAEYDTTDVRVETPDGEALGEVTAAIADTPELQATGLSDTDELPEDRGMLFVFDSVDEREFIMPDMSFGIDIVFADDEGVITGIHHAPEPGPNEDGSEQVYPGTGQYVLEVVYEWTADRGVGEGDVLQFGL
ncbi:DUF192 domain-containing protein [Halosolutus gelatinilyticus]|uniref:DUF192 domain-containing protein n=1 Tax=Halosolutus gelatinilyticus TaxID=2931975 RepID=UPI001FF381BA|nr:DUF192 domain-containing protein [Halosolutus gelatinilyticus]